jgi:hypothetical protein
MRKRGLEKGLISEGDPELLAKAWEEWKQRDDAIFCIVNGQLLVRK